MGSQVDAKTYEPLEYVLSDTSFWAQKFFKNWVKLYSEVLFYAITLYNTHISQFFYQLFWINIIFIYIKGFWWILRRRVPSWKQPLSDDQSLDLFSWKFLFVFRQQCKRRWVISKYFYIKLFYITIYNNLLNENAIRVFRPRELSTGEILYQIWRRANVENSGSKRQQPSE